MTIEELVERLQALPLSVQTAYVFIRSEDEDTELELSKVTYDQGRVILS